MESGRIKSDNSEEANGPTEVASLATYKSLPDQDIDWEKRQKENSTEMSKQGGDSEIDDGAREKMLKEESKISPSKDATEVKFISENGDAKIDIETVKQAFCGMGKEELMKFANDPFWIRLRWFLFVSFWLLWVAMLAGAIAIIVMAPKCSAPEPKQWYEESPIIQLEIADSPTLNLKGFESLLDDLKEKNIKAISLSSILKETTTGHTEDFKDVRPQIGQLSDLDSLIKAAKERDQNIILEIDPNHSSENHPWFKKSVAREEPYTSYYVWVNGIEDSNGKRSPPNNWLSQNGGSAWEWNEKRGQYYYHLFNKTQPDLNYNNSAVIDEFSNILNHWMKLGIRGFRLANTAYLTEDPQLRNEQSLSSSPSYNEYESLVHVYTRNRPENSIVLAKWKEVVANATEGKGLFALQGNIGADMLLIYNEKKQLVSLPQYSQFLETADQNIKAETLKKNTLQWLSQASWPAWDINGKRALRKRVPSDVADSLTLMTLLLRGTPILKYNDTSAKEAFTALTKARSTLTFLHGEYTATVLNNTVFVYTRLKSGNPGYIVAYHTGDEPVVVDFSKLPQISEEVNVLTYSPNYVQNGDTIRTKLLSNQISISPKSTLVLTFVPQN